MACTSDRYGMSQREHAASPPRVAFSAHGHRFTGRAAPLVLLNYVIGNRPDIGGVMPATPGCA
jgi:hypothetical protein